MTVLTLLAALAACASEKVPIERSATFDGLACAVVPEQGDWEYVGTAFGPGAQGDFDELLWGGFGGSPVRFGEEILLYYQGAAGYSEEQESVRFRAIGLAASRDGTTFRKDPASPVLEWAPSSGEEEGAASVAVARGPGGDLVAFYGANSRSGPTSVNADGRWAVSADGRSFEDRGIALDHADRRVFGAGDELFPVIAFHHGGFWFVYYLPNGGPRGELGVAWGSGPGRLKGNAPVRAGGEPVGAWGMQSAVHLCADRYALFLNQVEQKTMTVRLTDVSTPGAASEPVATYRFPATEEAPELAQGAVLLDREAGYWYLYYRTADPSRYDLRRAPLVTR